jgi:hypothetical protein
LSKGYSLVQEASTEGAFEFCFFETPEGEGIVELFYIKGLSGNCRTIA